MSALSVPNWWRMLGWGLLASFVLHWMVFDLLRAGRSFGPRSDSVLQVRLKEDVPPARAASSAPAVEQKSASAEVDGPARDKATPKSKPVAPSGDMSPSIATASSVETPVVRMPDGLRSGQTAEALVALRLAVAQSLMKSGPVSAIHVPRSVVLWCDYDEAGRLLAVRSEGENLPASARDWVRHAVAQLAVPQSLIGKSFSLDLLLDSDD